MDHPPPLAGTARLSLPARVNRGSIPWLPYAILVVIAACLFGIRLAAPPNLLDQDQERPAAYVLDVVKNGHWLCQTDLTGDITSKPPVYTWLSALVTLACGRISEFSLYLPGALAALGTAWLVFGAGRKHFGTKAGFVGAVAVMLCSAGLKEFGLARTDGIFAFTVTGAALVAFRAWNRGRGWTWFWLIAAVATLTKGPLGVILGGCGLLACYWERKSGHSARLEGSHALGLVLYFLVSGGWFLLAYSEVGEPLIHKMIFKELVGHAVFHRKFYFPGMFVWHPPLFYLARAAPWSLPAGYGLWRLWKHPASAELERRFERFLFCWFLGGLFIFGMVPHQRADLLWPLMPAAALIGGREIARLTRETRPALFAGAFAASVVIGTAGFAFWYFVPHGRTKVVEQTAALKRLALQLERRGGPEFPLTHVDDPTTLQVYLDTRRPAVSVQRAARLLRGREAAFLAVNNLEMLKAARRPGDPPLFILLPSAADRPLSPTRIISNRPALEDDVPTAFCFGRLYFRMYGARLVKATEREFLFAPTQRGANVVVVNESSEPRRVSIRSALPQGPTPRQRLLGCDQTWKVMLSSPARPGLKAR